MKKTLFSQLLLVVVMALVAANPVLVKAQDSKIETGIVNFQNSDFQKAYDALKVGLSNLAEVKPKNQPRGYYYLGMSAMQLMQAKAQGGNLEANASAISALLDEAYDAFMNARKTDVEGKWTDKVNKSLAGLNFSFLNGAMMGLNATVGDKMTPEEKQKAYAEVIKFTGRCIEIDGSSYMPYDLRAQALLAKNDSASAYADFQLAVAKFEAKAPERPDIFIAYSCWRMAVVERYFKKDLDMALKSIEKGKVLLEKEHSRVIAQKDKYKPEELSKIEEQYKGAQEDLNKLELDILLNAPEKLKEALGKFETATAKEPNNYILHVAYAQLLEKVDTVKAITIYEKATKIDNNSYLAFYNLGALYLNLGIKKYQDANKVDKNIELAKAMQKEGDEYYRKAFPVLARSLELEPCDGQILQAILGICINLGATDEKMMAEYTKYKKMKADCGK